jgi:enoyl-CoA hydratase
MSDEKLRYTLEGRVAVIHMDDGRVNSLSPEMLAGIEAQLDRAEKEAGAVVLVGREGRFCAGFDLATMGAGPEAAHGMVLAGAELLLRLSTLPIPVVAACTGHALAAGALLLLAADLRVGCRGEFKLGLNEVTIGMALPIFALELARERLSKRHFARATQMAEIYSPDTAVDAGYLDRVEALPDVLQAARGEATRLAELQQPAFRLTKQRNAEAMVERIRATLDEDVSRLTGLRRS